MRCVTCHGPKGEGNGPGSAALDPKPRNFTDPAWQASVTDEHIAKIVQFGGAAVGKSPAMPGNPDLMSKPEVLQALVAHVRGLAAPQ
jgi:mono/diheme cytochrome c family protein